MNKHNNISNNKKKENTNNNGNNYDNVSFCNSDNERIVTITIVTLVIMFYRRNSIGSTGPPPRISKWGWGWGEGRAKK